MQTNELHQSHVGFFQSSSDRPIIPFSLISSQMVNRLRQQSIPPLQQITYNSVADKALKYLQTYLRQFQKNKRLNSELSQVIQDRNLLADKYNSIKRAETTDDSLHRKRRYAKDIERLFHCPIERCKRGYGSQGSLSHHVRLKHMQFYESGQYQIFIQRYIDQLKDNSKKADMAQRNGQIEINVRVGEIKEIEYENGQGLAEQGEQLK